MYLFFDTETSGLPRSWKSPVTDLENWPRLVQLAYLQYDRDGKLLIEGNHIIRPVGFTIPKDASDIHKITQQRALTEGEDLSSVLILFDQLVESAECLVAHNMSFDEKIMGAEFLRNRMKDSVASKDKVCTMQSTTDFCAIKGAYGYKWPKLSELHRKLFGHDFSEAHDASVDIRATARCFWELKSRRLI